MRFEIYKNAEVAFLTCVDPERKHNKFYIIVKHNDGNGTFTALSGSLINTNPVKYLYTQNKDSVITKDRDTKICNLTKDADSKAEQQINKGYKAVSFQTFKSELNKNNQNNQIVQSLDNVIDEIKEKEIQRKERLEAERLEKEQKRLEDLKKAKEEFGKTVSLKTEPKIELNFY